MQYPIIDTFAQAYINNGWTGATVTTGKNLFDYHTMIDGDGWLRSDGELVVDTTWKYTSYIPVSNNKLTLSPTTGYSPSIILYDENKNYITGKSYNGNSSVTIESGVEASFCRFSINTQTMPFEDIQLEYGTEVTSYEPYGVGASSDFPHRLKLPLPHYFPHPVIDALQAAAAGTQTAEQTEVLRHYLTPLGIGGI